MRRGHRRALLVAVHGPARVRDLERTRDVRRPRREDTTVRFLCTDAEAAVAAGGGDLRDADAEARVVRLQIAATVLLVVPDGGHADHTGYLDGDDRTGIRDL